VTSRTLSHSEIDPLNHMTSRNANSTVTCLLSAPKMRAMNILNGWLAQGLFGFPIRALTERKRQYQWNSQHRTMKLMPRRKRWNGLLGLYNPGSEILPITLLNRTRIAAQGAQLHFESESETLEWLRGQRPMKWVYTSQGLAAGWFETPARNQVNVDVYQIYINRKNPVNLPGSNDDAIQVRMPR
jgi:hypothetical protein